MGELKQAPSNKMELMVVVAKKNPGLYAVAATKNGEHTKVVFGRVKQRDVDSIKKLALTTVLSMFVFRYDILIKDRDIDIGQQSMYAAERNILADLQHSLEKHKSSRQTQTFTPNDRLILKFLNSAIRDNRSLKPGETRTKTYKTEKILKDMLDIEAAKQKNKKYFEDLEALSSGTYIVADIETTGISIQHRSEIIEIAALKIQNGKIADVFSKFIKPNVKISAKTTELTGITQEMVDDAEPFHIVLREFFSFIGAVPIVFHNAQFDWNNFLVPFFKKIMLFPENKVVDSLKIARSMFPELSSHKLNILSEHLDIHKEGDFHRAIYDTEILHEIVLVMLDKAEISRSEELDALEDDEDEGKILFPNFKVTGTREWKTDDGGKHRVYVYTTLGSCYYDKLEGVWYNDTIKANVDISELEKMAQVL